MPASLIQPAQKARPFSSVIITLCLLLAVNSVGASPCSRLKAQPDIWVAARVDALIMAARGAYESDRAIPLNQAIRALRLSEMMRSVSVPAD